MEDLGRIQQHCFIISRNGNVLIRHKKKVFFIIMPQLETEIIELETDNLSDLSVSHRLQH